NPCPCGYVGHRQRPCRCTPAAVSRYRSRLSGPLLDRIDLRAEIPALDPAELRGPPEPGGGTEHWRQRVLAARSRQLHRRRAHRSDTDLGNARLDGDALLRACDAAEGTLRLLDEVLRRRHETGRGRVRLLRLARTLADLDDRPAVEDVDVFEAAALRGREDRTFAATP
ncbi:MAG: ATP-binding protein, partial [Planctomycetes bacterium]|nr:ATP-binding protein [Planctomycetota bacterium]